MKTFVLSTLCLISVSSVAGDFNIAITRDANISDAAWLNSMTVTFHDNGSNFNDPADQTAAVNNNFMCFPFTRNSSYANLTVVDSRPALRRDRVVNFGIINPVPGSIHVQGSWNSPADSALCDVLLVDNITGNEYNLYNEIILPYGIDTLYSSRFNIVFMIRSIEPQWNAEVLLNSIPLTSFSCSGSDTLLTGLSAGNYTVIYNIDGFINDTCLITISSPAQIIADALPASFSTQAGEALMFTNLSTGATHYLWNFGDGNLDTTSASPSHTFTSPGNYTVTLTAYNASSCSETFTMVITVNPPTVAPPPSMVNRHDENDEIRSGNNVTIISDAGTARIVNENPEIAVSAVRVFTLNGALAAEGENAVTGFGYNAPGVYIIQITFSDGSVTTQRTMLN
jgi:hypothetical protein